MLVVRTSRQRTAFRVDWKPILTPSKVLDKSQPALTKFTAKTYNSALTKRLSRPYNSILGYVSTRHYYSNSADRMSPSAVFQDSPESFGAKDSAKVKAANSKAATHQKVNAWQSPGPAAYDFRSDTHTTPTAKMLEAITNTTLLDDVFSEDTTTNDLESYLADLSGHEAGLLVMSGTMGNQIALRCHLTQPPHSVLCDTRGHINNYEAGGTSSLSNAMLIPIQPSNNHHLTLADIQRHAIVSDDIHACPTRVISLENTLDGMIMPLSELKLISAWSREHNIKLHMDGARIWEAVAADAGSLPDFTSLCDSVSMCFSKGLGAPIGSLLVGDKTFITHARRIRKMIGGGTRQAGIISAAARVAVDVGFGTDIHGSDGHLRASHANARKVADMWDSKGGRLSSPTETNMVWLDLADAGISNGDFAELAATEGLKARSGRLVVHYQIADEAIEKLGRVMDQVLGKWRAEKKRKGEEIINGSKHGNGVKKGRYD